MMIDADTAIPLLQAIGMAEAKDEVLDDSELERLAEDLDTSIEHVRLTRDSVERAGLAHFNSEEPAPPFLLRAGRQYLERDGQVPGDVLSFLPNVIDDLNTRDALLSAGTVLVDEFHSALAEGKGAEHARSLVPAAFEEAVDDEFALRLFAAAAALMARLSNDAPAGCVAEEVLAVALMENAAFRIEGPADLDEEEAAAATEELRSLFDLFEDDDVLAMFEMSEPADAAVAGRSWINQQAGVADQRIEAWFKPFGGVAATGHLDAG